MDRKKWLVAAVLVLLIIGIGGLAAWKTLNPVAIDGQATGHEGAITRMLGWLGSFYSAQPTVHKPGHERVGDEQQETAKTNRAGD